MQAIVTKYLCPTNSRGARVKATCQAGSMTVAWDHALNATDNHREAGMALVFQRGWYSHGTWKQGALPNGDYVLVCDEGQ
jgi:hypothetical protein